MIKLTALDHVVLRTGNVASMVKFYTQVLGCTVERKQDIGLIQLRAGSSMIDIVPIDSELGNLGGGEPTRPCYLDHICLRMEVCDESEVIAFLKKHGVSHGEFVSRYGAQGLGHSLYLKDPDGNDL